MKNLLTFCMLLSVMMACAKEKYLFTEISTCHPDERQYRDDPVTWVFDTDSGYIRIRTEREDIHLQLLDHGSFFSEEDSMYTDKYITIDGGNIYVDWALELPDRKGDFLQVVYSIGDSQYIYKVK